MNVPGEWNHFGSNFLTLLKVWHNINFTLYDQWVLNSGKTSKQTDQMLSGLWEKKYKLIHDCTKKSTATEDTEMSLLT